MVLRFLSFSLYTFCSLLFILPAPSQSQEPIKIITNNWTSQIVLSYITGNIFQAQGATVEYIPSSVSNQWGALAHGAAHIQVEVWEGTMSDQFNRLVSAGTIIDAGSHNATTLEDWWYPKYVEALCPGLPDWRALKACAAIFQRPDSQGKGVYFAGPWEKPDEARIRALGLDLQVRVLSQGDDLWVELKKAYETQTPIILFNWTPNWVESRYEGDFVEFPQYEPACETDPSWGINPQFIHDCGNPIGGWLKKASAVSFTQNYPCAFSTLKNISLNNQQIAVIAALVDVDKLSFQAAAEQWMQNNTSLWQSWIPQECLK
ncbi:MAG: glycine betaine/proline transport system substrate-binding protein [Oleispira sp.]|jgi:glycine betaine/proline transport system substrate-binding protein